MKNQIYLGDERFVEKMQQQLAADAPLGDIHALHTRPVAKPLADYARKHKTRDEAIIAAYRSGGYSQKQIADYFELHYSWVSRVVKKSEQERIKA